MSVAVEAAEEAALVRQVLDGRAAAFDALVRRHSPRVFRFLRQFVRHQQDAEDLTQQTFVKAFRKLDSFDPERPLIAWLLTIARRTALNHFRDARQWEPLGDNAAPAPEASPDAAAAMSEAKADLWEQAKERLSPREYSVLWLRFGEDFSVRETARVMGLTQTHVKILVFRAKRALMKAVKP